eukprot:m.315995 g.315995  ORF g.315995 m.315995 type:complete len:378 (+) comp16418_c0_seq3:238-1371(+)
MRLLRLGYCLGMLVLARSGCAVVTLSPAVQVYIHGEGGYPCIRTPSVVRTPNRTLLAFAGTRCGKGDGCYPTVPYNTSMDHQDAVLKRSTDGGLTWAPLSVLNVGTCADRNHGCPVVDTHRNTVVFVFNDGPLAWIRSHDDGLTWSAPKPVDLGNYSVARVSPGRGLQLRQHNPKAPGRLLMVAQLETNIGDIVFYSDDGGDSWTRSPTVIPSCNEAQMVELANGTVLLNARDESAPHAGSRRVATSTDGGATWTPHPALVTDLGNTNCMGSIFAPTQTGPIYFSHPFQHNPTAVSARSNGTVFVSTDQAATFRPLVTIGHGDPDQRSAQKFAYSCLTDLDETGGLGLIYETGDHSKSGSGCTADSASCKIMFTRVV